MTISDFRQLFVTSLSRLYSEQETRAIFHLYMDEKFHIPFSQLYLNMNQPLSETIDYQGDLERLSRGEPIQYVMGQTEFYGLTFGVNPSVLIPRPETEELVDAIINKVDKNQKIRILDIGTGSGAIAISLAAHLPNAEVFAVDCSEKALAVAQNNAKNNAVQVTFVKWNIFDSIPATIKDIDILVSNPPYIPVNERDKMQINVTAYEPSLALFVPDDAPIIFYKHIAEVGKTLLKPQGSIAVEIHEDFGNQVVDTFTKEKFKEVTLMKDLNGKDRFVFCKKNE
ncbi:MAG: peptide chain release factor N(5)-glutamine methyltransferase [Bacteroidales bacterium]|nr:peptide chain release factor N(5)-glutamine methyltransferase [Bacteroidales bacterium]